MGEKSTWFPGTFFDVILMSKDLTSFLVSCKLMKRFEKFFPVFVTLNSWLLQDSIPMDTSSSIRHRFDAEIPRGKFVEITSILKGESTWKLWHRFDVDSTFKIDEISMSSPRGFFYVVSTSNRRNFCTRCFHFLTFSALGTYSKLFWYNTESL